MTTINSLEDAVLALKELDREIREYYPAEPWNRQPAFSRPLRNLTIDEWEMVARSIKDHELPCRLMSSSYDFSLHIYGHCEFPDMIQPGVLLIIEYGQFPFPCANRGFAGQEETLRKLSSITHSARNKELLAFYHFKPLMEVESYAY